MKASDPKSRIFVGQGFVVKPALEQAVAWLELLLKQHPEMIAMLEFTSKGKNHRQIDCALVGLGGIDLIEIKNKHGVVRGSPEGEWTVTYRGVTESFFNLKNRIEENPFNQARNTADDLRDWIKETYGQKVWVSPIVWLPSADPASQIERDSFVWHAVGIAPLRSKLRSSIKQTNVWGRLNYLGLPAQFQLKPINLSFIRGRVVEPVDGHGLADVTVIVKVGDVSEQLRTDQHGQYDFTVNKGSAVEVAFAVPERYQQPPALNFDAQLDYSTLASLVLTERVPRKSEEEIREDERQRMLEGMEARITAQAAQSKAAWQDAHARMGLVIDDLNGQLRDTLLRLAERERLLQEQQAKLYEHQRPSLPVQVQQANEALQIRHQREQVKQALQLLSVSNNQEQQQAVNHSLDVLAQVAVSSRYALSRPVTLLLSVQDVAQQPREPDTVAFMEPTYEAEVVDVPAEFVQAVPVKEAPPQPVAEDKPTHGLDIPTAAPRQLWPWVAVMGVIALIGGGWLWQASQKQELSLPAVVETAPFSESVPVPEALPGKPANESTSNSGDLPGVPYH